MIRLILPLMLSLAAPAMAADAAPTRSLYLQLIHQARADGRPRAALAYLDDFDRQYPGDADARLLRINSLLDLGQIDAAEAITLPPDGPGVSAIRGHLLGARGHWREAVSFYQAAAQASPADPLTRNALGYALLRAGQTTQAVEAFRAAADLAPGAEVIRNNLLLALTVEGRNAEAEALLRQIGDGDARQRLRGTLAAEAARIRQGG
jgi:Flp pilus assembly protein TadD